VTIKTCGAFRALPGAAQAVPGGDRPQLAGSVQLVHYLRGGCPNRNNTAVVLNVALTNKAAGARRAVVNGYQVAGIVLDSALCAVLLCCELYFARALCVCHRARCGGTTHTALRPLA
jgi:hypothetical protein